MCWVHRSLIESGFHGDDQFRGFKDKRTVETSTELPRPRGWFGRFVVVTTTQSCNSIMSVCSSIVLVTILSHNLIISTSLFQKWWITTFNLNRVCKIQIQLNSIKIQLCVGLRILCILARSQASSFKQN